MKAFVQRVTQCRVLLPEHENICSGKIGPGMMVLLGIGKNDTREEALFLVKKLSHLRIFDDSNGKMNLDVHQTGGEIMVVSQFTLWANCQRGNRPSFTEAAPPEQAQTLYEFFVEELQKEGLTVATGVFREYMSVELINDGPISILLDTDSICA